MPSCNATYKLAIKFANWRADGGHFYHPFQRYEIVDGFNMAEWWLKLKRDEEPFDYACFTIPAMCDAKRSPRFLDGRVFDDKVQDYFADGRRAEEQLPRRAQGPVSLRLPLRRRPARRVPQGLCARSAASSRSSTTWSTVNLREDGGIDHVVTKEHGAIHGDLFVDCTGFRGLLINQALQRAVHLVQRLAPLRQRGRDAGAPRHRGATASTPTRPPRRMNSRLVVEHPALRPDRHRLRLLQPVHSPRKRRSSSSATTSGPAADGCRANHIKMRIGRCRNSWVKNCVAIGLSSGFVEPLESTGIFFIQHGIEELVNHFPGGAHRRGDGRAATTGWSAECIDGVRDFLTLHYCTTDRDGHASSGGRRSRSRSRTTSRSGSTSGSSAPAERQEHQPDLPRLRGLLLLGDAARPQLPARAEPAGARPHGRHATPSTPSAPCARGPRGWSATLPSQYEYLTGLRAERFAAA